ncbi:hypothetical protein SASPL_113506 [Salvia splendens]|uniref:Uncharacterized protein n=1 Tax=Salvia splendens TaxID=180675 RepID=A0A8X8Y4R0_SALSN|nr:uncharacterized protein LOC121804355 [Salvia splendens]KAG6423121.1 hypothetical protein SASPL_113506 [Salvia splendens]
MGNQNTSGLQDEEAKNEAPDNGQGVSPPHAVTVQKLSVVQETVAEAEGDKIPPVEIKDKDIEDHNGSFEGCDAVMDISSNGSDLGEGMSKLSDEQDQPCTLTDIEEEEIVLMDEDLEVDDHDAKEKDKDSVLADAPSVEGVFSEACMHEEELGRDDEPLLEEQSDSLNTVDEAARTSLPDSSTSQNEHENECSALDHEEKQMIHELGNGDDEPSDQENDQFLTRCSSDPTEVIKVGFEENVDHLLEDVEKQQDSEPTDQEKDQFLTRCSSDPTEVIKAEFEINGDHLLEDAEKQQENEPTNQNVIEEAIHLESDTSATEDVYETESEATDKCVIELKSSTEIDTQRLSNEAAEAETPPASDETEPNPSCVGAQVELRKSPSFDFGISFDTRSEESDQTPLLYQDKTARRSLFSCSNLRFPNTEYVGKPLQFQAVQLEEKTIRMERSNSENAQKSVNNTQEKANAVKEDAHTNGSKASPSRDEAAVSPKGNRRRKARSSLFTTCICCTAAIS